MRASRLGEIQDRFWGRVDKRQPEECWLWKGTKGPSGYGIICGSLSGVYVGRVLAHRAAWMLVNGPVPSDGPGHHGWVVMHTCDNRKCVNPAHLVLGTQGENIKDMDRKGRANRSGLVPESGVKHRRAALDAEQVADVLQSQETHKALAQRLGVSIDTIKRVRSGQTYGDQGGFGKVVRPRFSAPGEKNPGARLTYEQVKFIRTSGLNTYQLAEALGISQVCAAMARRGATYKDVDIPCPPPKIGRQGQRTKAP